MQPESLNKILDFIESCAEAPKQRTPEWHDARANSFGGSIMGCIDGNNPYQSLADVVLERLDIAPVRYQSWLAANWGNMFEDVITEYIEHKYSTKVYGTNIFHRHNPHMHYSPDGLMPVLDKVALLEFKCPFSRVPNGRIPAHYESQVLAGLGMLPITDNGLYVDAMFKRCAAADWSMASGEFIKNTASDKYKQKGAVLAKGYFAFDLPEDWDFMYASAETNEIDPQLSRQHFDELLQQSCEGHIKHTYVMQYDDAAAAGNDYNAVMYWKLLDVKEVVVHKQDDYITSREGFISNLCARLAEIRAITCEDQKREAAESFIQTMRD